MWVNCGELQNSCPSCLSSFHWLQTFLSFHCYSLHHQSYKRHWNLSGFQGLISSRQKQSRYLTVNLLFWLQAILLFLHFNFSPCDARSSWLMLVWIIPRIIIQRITIPTGAQESRYSIFISPAFDQSPLPDVLQVVPACLVTHILNS